MIEINRVREIEGAIRGGLEGIVEADDLDSRFLRYGDFQRKIIELGMHNDEMVEVFGRTGAPSMADSLGWTVSLPGSDSEIPFTHGTGIIVVSDLYGPNASSNLTATHQRYARDGSIDPSERRYGDKYCMYGFLKLAQAALISGGGGPAEFSLAIAKDLQDEFGRRGFLIDEMPFLLGGYTRRSFVNGVGVTGGLASRDLTEHLITNWPSEGIQYPDETKGGIVDRAVAAAILAEDPAMRQVILDGVVSGSTIASAPDGLFLD